MNTCPCCSAKMLRHVNRSGVYWFCPHCRLEVTDLSNLSLMVERKIPNYSLTIQRIPMKQRLHPTLEKIPGDF
ncbi:hypothetical protein [Argonema antarcticum]|uniref:hypothetical protein n=1 Tax=Argonema antarcticum TaxID=2942763 RepID=UPI002010EEBF|nr:hypothetical protein [Argonema antarcticum]MCL1469882.1 hypothetical protein [Argonema antarcticum A004/B2]